MKNFIVCLAVVAILFSSCSSNVETANGTVINYFEKGNGDTPVDSLVSLFNIRYTTEDGKVMLESDSDNPRPIKIDPNSELAQGELFEVLKLLRTGDSVGFEIVASDLFDKTFNQPLPDSISPESMVQFQIAYIDQLTESGYFEMISKKAEEAASKQVVIDSRIIQEYLDQMDIEAEKTESGLRYIINEEGTGEKPTNGQSVSVNYAGRLLTGEYFDTSIESVAKAQGLFQAGRNYAPFTFPLGEGRVIKGWDEGIALLNKGTKATLYIPSTLGYGNRGTGPIIKPNSILVFDVELVDFE